MINPHEMHVAALGYELATLDLQYDTLPTALWNQTLASSSVLQMKKKYDEYLILLIQFNDISHLSNYSIVFKVLLKISGADLLVSGQDSKF